MVSVVLELGRRRTQAPVDQVASNGKTFGSSGGQFFRVGGGSGV